MAKKLALTAVLSAILAGLFTGCWTSQSEKQHLLAKPNYEASLAYYREGKVAQAKEEILLALEKYPEFTEAHIHYQVIRAREIEPKELLDEYDRLLKQNQSDARFHFLYGRLLADIEKQEAVYQRTVQLDEKSPWGHFGLGWVSFKRSDYETAVSYFNKAIDLDPENPLFHNDLGGVYYFMGMYEEAIAELSLARELNPLYPVPFANLATAYYQRGDFDMAIDMLEEYLRLFPAAPDAQETQRKLVQLRGK
ncbi:MAG TPA: tetratricopeptide repeat protein [candidate division Zixibacteria bacterium]|nr:tetratricopeptide repeat protein [candidate division Zixibacteria bacterium]